MKRTNDGGGKGGLVPGNDGLGDRHPDLILRISSVLKAVVNFLRVSSLLNEAIQKGILPQQSLRYVSLISRRRIFMSQFTNNNIFT